MSQGEAEVAFVDETYSDGHLREILRRTRTIAMIGASANWKRPSYFAMKYLLRRGFEVTPVNPKVAAAGDAILGRRAYASLEEVPGDVDMVDVFRPSAAVPGIVDDVLRLARTKNIRTLWLQLGVFHEESAQRARDAGIDVVMNRCPKIEYGRLHGELSWGGFNSGVISSRRR